MLSLYRIPPVAKNWPRFELTSSSIIQPDHSIAQGFEGLTMSRWNLAWLLGITAAAVLGISITYSAPTNPTRFQKKHENIKLIVDVLDEVQRKYVKELDQDKMRELVEHMVNGGLEKLDPHSQFIGADEYRQFRQNNRGKFGGVGIRLGLDPKTGNY